jgi:hypothetical protein
MVPPVANEREALLSYLAQQRYVLKLTAHGLTDEQARATPSASALSVGGLIKHSGFAERNWVNMVTGRERLPQADYAAGFLVGSDETLAEVIEGYDTATAETDAVMAEVTDLGQPVPVPQGVPWFPDDVDAWSVRWVLLHLIEETARHAGHADIVRESIDGASAFSLMAAAEGWEPTPWLQPWRPAVQH